MKRVYLMFTQKNHKHFKYYFSLSMLMLAVLITSCENEYETIHKYSRPYYLIKDYPIYLDPSNILTDIQVKPSVNPEEPFKIVSTDGYIFVGEMMKGIHVYEKTDTQHANPLCFIECKFMKAFDVINDHLYCNNFVDLLVIDVKNPMQAKILHREGGYFNRYYDYNMNMPTIYSSTKPDLTLYEIANKSVELSGVETDANPAPGFSEYDQLYGEIVVDAIPDTLTVDKPYAGFVEIGGMMHTFGYNSLALCDYGPKGFQSAQSVVTYPNNNTNTTLKLLYENEMLFILNDNCIYYYDYNNTQIQTIFYHYYLNSIIDASYMKSQKTFWFLSNNGIVGRLTTDDQYFYPASVNINGVNTITSVGDYLITLGSRLEIYSAPSLDVVKRYPDISGLCMLKEDNTLITVDKQGLFFYDISDLNDIKLIH